MSISKKLLPPLAAVLLFVMSVGDASAAPSVSTAQTAGDSFMSFLPFHFYY